MQADNRDRGPAAGAAAGQGKTPTICSRLQRAFQARPAFRPLLRLTGHSQDGGAATTGGEPATTHGGAPTPIVLPAHAPAPSHVGKAPKPPAPVTHGGAPPPIVLPAHAPTPSPSGKAPKPTAPVVTLPAVPGKPHAGKVPTSASTNLSATANKVGEKVAGWMPAPAKGGDKPAGKVPATSTPTTLSATANKVAEKVAGWMPTPAKGGDKPAGKVPASSTPTTVSATANKVAEKVSGWMPVPTPPAAVTTERPPADAKAEDKAQQTKGRVRVSSRVRKALSSSK
ncbi:skin secretory protein xP2-like [Lolium rigidum]|uniref:skin secretory protein xP2-like n=1 Tax=Lolium rigidum TaxID=89674 RepID=UPI001F5C4C4F|nr:skin secretory protein xP2-like [Lolium rigidum]